MGRSEKSEKCIFLIMTLKYPKFRKCTLPRVGTPINLKVKRDKDV